MRRCLRGLRRLASRAHQRIGEYYLITPTYTIDLVLIGRMWRLIVCCKLQVQHLGYLSFCEPRARIPASPPPLCDPCRKQPAHTRDLSWLCTQQRARVQSPRTVVPSSDSCRAHRKPPKAECNLSNRFVYASCPHRIATE